MHVVLLRHGEVSLVRLRAVWMTNGNHPPSVLWHCWLGHQTCKNISSQKWPILCRASETFNHTQPALVDIVKLLQCFSSYDVEKPTKLRNYRPRLRQIQ